MWGGDPLSVEPALTGASVLGAMDARRVAGRWLLMLGVAAGLLLLWCAPASALLGRGHVFAGAFEGAGASQLMGPSGVAVDEASGDVFVVDRSVGHERVERFAPDGKGGYRLVSAFAVRSPEAI